MFRTTGDVFRPALTRKIVRADRAENRPRGTRRDSPAPNEECASPGDGIKCVGGPFVRLGSKINAAGASRFPSPIDTSLSVKGRVTAPGARHYEVRYRNAVAFCTAETFNYTNAVTIVWNP